VLQVLTIQDGGVKLLLFPWWIVQNALPTTMKEPAITMIRLVTAPLPAGTSIECYRRMDKNGSFVQANLEGGGTSFNTEDSHEAYFLVGDKGKIVEVQLVLNSSGNLSPEVYECQVLFE
jgi:hypothetical protein